MWLSVDVSSSIPRHPRGGLRHAPAAGKPRHRGRLAQLVEHLVYTEIVGGSSPSPPTIPPQILRAEAIPLPPQPRFNAVPPSGRAPPLIPFPFEKYPRRRPARACARRPRSSRPGAKAERKGLRRQALRCLTAASRTAAANPGPIRSPVPGRGPNSPAPGQRATPAASRPPPPPPGGRPQGGGASPAPVPRTRPAILKEP